MNRIYENILIDHLAENRQMAFLSGPRQVGKTTSVKKIADHYLSWDSQNHRQLILAGPDHVADFLNLGTLRESKPRVVFDELHKYTNWKQFIKGFFDVYGEQVQIIVTGSARLNIYKRGGDSLMGRYFIYRMHPLSVAEIGDDKRDQLLSKPTKPAENTTDFLLTFGGFPEPFIKSNSRFYNRWRRLRSEQFFLQDIRDLTRVQEAGQIQVLAELLSHQVGQLLNYSSLAVRLNLSVDTVRRWISILESLYYCYTIQPWFTNVAKSLRKQPKVYLWDWCFVSDPAKRYENFIASSLLKAVHYWTDLGIGDFSLHYLRDKTKREVDFLISRDQKPWILVEAKSSHRPLSPQLAYFQDQTKAEHAFQVTKELEYVDKDCFTQKKPVIVPAETFLSQLV